MSPLGTVTCRSLALMVLPLVVALALAPPAARAQGGAAPTLIPLPSGIETRLTLDPDVVEHRGELFALHRADRAGRNGDAHWTVTRSRDGGRRWAVILSAQPGIDGAGQTGGYYPTKISSVGDLLSIGGSSPEPAPTRERPNPNYRGGSRWTTLRSFDRGEHWEMVDYVNDYAGSEASTKIVANSKGQLFAAGIATDELGRTLWITRQADAVGTNWRTVDRFVLSGFAKPTGGIAIGPQDEIYVAGWGYNQRQNVWLIRRSLDDGHEWRTSQPFNDPRISSVGHDIVVDREGQVWTAGTMTQDTGSGLRTKGVLLLSGNQGREFADVKAPDGVVDVLRLHVNQDGSMSALAAFAGYDRTDLFHRTIDSMVWKREARLAQVRGTALSQLTDDQWLIAGTQSCGDLLKAVVALVP